MPKKADPVASRVATRFASEVRPPPPLKLRNRMEYLRSGYGTLKRDEVFEILAYFGWKVEPVTAPLKHGFRGEKLSKDFGSMERAREFYESRKPREVKAPPAEPEVKKFYLGDIEEPAETPYGFTVKYHLWEGVEAWRVSSPDGQETFTLLPSEHDKIKLRKRIDPTPLIKWLRAETDLPELIAEIGDDEREKYVRSRDNTGSCPCCMRNIKLEDKGKQLPGMVFHGYRRPGLGQTYGRCPGTEFPPYELSAEGTIHLRDKLLKPLLANLRDYRKRLDAGSVESIVRPPNRVIERATASDEEWEKALKEARGSNESHIKETEKALDVVGHLISTWKLQPLPEEGQEYPVSRHLVYTLSRM